MANEILESGTSLKIGCSILSKPHNYQKSCKGCSLNRLPEVKKFILNDAPNYEHVEVKFISGAPPELVLLDARDKEVDRLPLSQLNREQCNQLLQDQGFVNIKKSEF